MRSIAEIDRDHEGMGKACVRHSYGCTYPHCECDRSKRIVPNVRGVGGPGRQGDTCVHNRDERECGLCQRHAQQLAPGVPGLSTRHPAPDAAAPMVPSPSVTLRMGSDGKLHPAGVSVPGRQTKQQ